jgi:hypothetical protein
MKLADIAVGETKRIETLPSMTGTAFYMTYHITVEGISFPYYDGNSFAAARLDEGKTARVPVPALRGGAVPQVYVKIINNGDVSLTFRKGNSELTPLGADWTLMMSGETAVYRLEAGPVAGYTFMKNGSDPVAFPDAVSAFEAGHIYTFAFNGSAAALTKTAALDLAAIIAAPPPVPEGVTFAWSGDWIRTAENDYTSNPIRTRQETIETLTITTAVPLQLTIELTVSCPVTNNYGRASQLDNALSAGHTIEVAGRGRKTHTYTVPAGTHRIQFMYYKNVFNDFNTEGSAVAKILSVQ